MATCIAFIIGIFAGAIVCLFGIALVSADEQYEAYQHGYTDGYKEGQKGA